MTINKLIIAGQQLSNICYNMKQDKSLPEHVRASMERCVKEWDEAKQEYFGPYKPVGPVNKF